MPRVSAEAKKRAKHLEEILAATGAEETKPSASVVALDVPIDSVVPSPTNPRKRFDETALAELAQSIREQGLLQRILVRPRPQGAGYELVAGERRFRAAKLAGWEHIPAEVRELSDAQVIEAQITENNQRRDVHAMEEALAYRQLLDMGHYGEERVAAIGALAAKLGRSQSYVYQRLQLLKLIQPIQEAFLDGEQITAGHAVLLAALPAAEQERVWQHRFRDGLTTSVRELKSWIQSNVLRKVSSFPFKISDGALLPEAGPCTTCPKNTGVNRHLFDDEDADAPAKGCCSDPVCLGMKVRNHEERLREEIKAKHGQAPALLSEQTYYSSRQDVVRAEKWKEAKPGEEGAKPGLVVENRSGSAAYKEVWFKPPPSFGTTASGTPKQDPEVRAARLEELRLQRAENLTRQRVYEDCLAAIDAGKGADLLAGPLAPILVAKALAHVKLDSKGDCKLIGPTVSEIAKAMGWTGLGGYHQGKVPSIEEARAIPAPGTIELARVALQVVCVDEVAYHDWYKPSGFALFAFAEALGVDVVTIRLQSDWDTLNKKRQAERPRPEAPKTLAQVLNGDDLQTSTNGDAFEYSLCPLCRTPYEERDELWIDDPEKGRVCVPCGESLRTEREMSPRRKRAEPAAEEEEVVDCAVCGFYRPPSDPWVQDAEMGRVCPSCAETLQEEREA